MHRMPECNCPVCCKKITAASTMDDDAKPEPGDVSVCFECTAFLVFNDDLTVRAMPDEEFKALDHVTRAELQGMRQFRLQFERPKCAS